MANSFPPLPKKKRLKAAATKEEKKQFEDIKKKKVEQYLKAHDKKVAAQKDAERIRKENAEARAAEYLKTKKRHGLFDEEIKTFAPPEVVDEITKGKKVIFEPYPKQVAYLQSDEDHVLAGGGRASGKSAAFIFEPLRYVDKSNFRGLFIRKNLTDLRDLIRRANELYKALMPSVQFKIKENLFLFPSGATIEFGHLDDEQAVEKYRGQEYSYIGIDEISQIPEYDWVSRLLGSLRSSDEDQKVYFRATTNWTGVGIDWVKEYFYVDVKPEAQTILERSEINLPDGTTKEVVLTKKWFNSTIFDNPKMANDAQYLAFLNSQPEHLKRAWLYGETSSAEGIAFPDFSKATHVCEPFEIPKGWKRYSGCDYGYNDGAANIWITVDPKDETTYIYREYLRNQKADKGKHLTAEEFAVDCLKIEEEANEWPRWRIIDGSVYDKRGSSEPSLYEGMRKVGFIARPADQSKGSRVAGKNKIHELLRIPEGKEKPKLMVFNNCPHIIKMFYGLPLDKHNAEDVDTDSPLDCVYDALRYVLMSRPSHRPKLVGENRPIPYTWR
jgi:hypothetical protein